MKTYADGIVLSKSIAQQYDSFRSNMNELTKMLNEATEFVKGMSEFSFISDHAGPRSKNGAAEKLNPKKWAHSVFFHNTVGEEEVTEPDKTDFLLVLMILLEEAYTRTPMDCVSLSLIRYSCLDKKGKRQTGNEWEFMAIASGSRKDWCNYSISEWSSKVVKSERSDNGQVFHSMHIPVGCIEQAEDFPLLLRPCIESLVTESHGLIADLPLYVPSYIL